jgi:predicted RNA binding protein YcfA (HicA-like mRNA interferase family)
MSLKGIRTDGSLVLMRHPDHIQMALIGNESFVDIKKENLSWPLQSIKVYTDDMTEILLKPLEDGWYRMEKKGEQRFYRIYGK